MAEPIRTYIDCIEEGESAEVTLEKEESGLMLNHTVSEVLVDIGGVYVNLDDVILGYLKDQQ